MNREGQLRGQPANPGSPGKMAVKTVCVCVCVVSEGLTVSSLICDRSAALKLRPYGAL